MIATENTRNVIVLGATGKVGTRLARVWAAHPPSGFDPVWVGRRADDLPGSGAVSRVWAPNQPITDLPRAGAVVALWGVVSGALDAALANVALARAAHDLARDLGADRVIHLSTQAVYGRAGADARETQAPTPAAPYGQAKHRMEQEIAGFSGPKSVILRIANVIGADALGAAMEAGKPITLDQFPDGHGPLRSYIAMRDLARIIENLVIRPADTLPDLFNVAAPDPVAMADILTAAGLAFDWRPAGPGALQCASVNTGRLVASGVPVPQANDAAALVADWREWRA